MKKLINAGLVFALLVGAVIAIAQESANEMAEMPEMPKPVEQHEWLQKFVGEWELESVVTMGPDQPPFESEGTETVRSIGGFWVVSEIKGICPMDNSPFTGILTLGFDPEKDTFIGSWIDSVTSTML